MQPLGTCKALYPFDGEKNFSTIFLIPFKNYFFNILATSEGSIPMAEGEELHVIELDQGDGWTRVRRMAGSNIIEEGFVPTTYIESTLYA